jgi:hypothetical protein
MARPLRLQFAGAVYHLTSQGNTRQKIFSMTPTASYFLRPPHTRISLPLDLSCLSFDGESLSFADRDPKANIDRHAAVKRDIHPKVSTAHTDG